MPQNNYRNEEQRLKNAILEYILFHPRKGFAWSQYNGAVYDPVRKCFRSHSKFQRKGVPDIIGVWCRRPLFIEVKTKVGRLSDDQKRFLEQASVHGAIAFVAREYEVAVNVLSFYDVHPSIQKEAPFYLKNELNDD
jgi:hypothetical protein